MESPKKNSKKRSNPTQVKLLVDFMAQNPMFANGEYGGPLGRRGHEEMWGKLAVLLAEHGPSKTVEQWKTTWRDLKKNARRDNASYNRGLNETGNPQRALAAVNEQNQKILSVIGVEMSIGIGPKESLIDHGQLLIPAIRMLPRVNASTAFSSAPSTYPAPSFSSTFATAPSVPSTSTAAPPVSSAPSAAPPVFSAFTNTPPVFSSSTVAQFVSSNSTAAPSFSSTFATAPSVPSTSTAAPPVSSTPSAVPPVSSTSTSTPLVPSTPNTPAATSTKQKNRKRQSTSQYEDRLIVLQEENNATLNGILQALNRIAAELSEGNNLLSRIVPFCADGKTKSFDKSADGCAKSEAINIIFLQKAKDAKRIYADICYIKSRFSAISGESGHNYGPQRDPAEFSLFLKEFYNEVGVSPAAVEYVEAFGSAIPDADKSELEAISDVFCKDRTKPLLVGSVMSNIGFTEAASGISAITKVLLGYHTGQLAANLHCDNPRDDVEALREGRMRIVNEHQQFGRSYVGLNNLSITGLNLHVLLDGHFKPKDLSRYQSSIPYLVNISGRQETGVYKIINELTSHPIDPEEIGLLHGIHEDNISGHLGRGFCILDTVKNNRTISLKKYVTYSDDVKKPLWFVYSGMGSQWAGMGTQLMRIPVFAAAIERCQAVLEPKGIDIVDIITSSEKTTFNNILHSFVGIAAIQIGLTDILRELGLVPDNIIGHSVGELGCAYADGCFTAEEMILSAYSRGLVSLQTPFIHGSMAAVGLGYQQVVNMCPSEIQVACHNSSESSTISGPSDKMKEFTEKLTSQGIFAKEVPCSNIAYHSRYIKEAGPALLKYLKEVIKSPKARSDKWVSTSVPQEMWGQTPAKFSSAEYHTNNLLSPVLFEETSKLIPSNAVVIEVAPHGLLQAILKRSLPSTCVNVPLTRRGHQDNALFLLEAIGTLYTLSYNPKIKALYPKIEYPVSTGTPMLSHLVEWVHQDTWSLANYATVNRKIAAATNFVISVHDDEFSFLRGNVHGDDTLYPFSGALVYVWDTLVMSVGAMRHELSVEFQNVHCHEQPRLNDDTLLRLSVQLNKGNGYFEVINGNNKVISGYIFGKSETAESSLSQTSEFVNEMSLSEQDVYKVFNERDSYYSGEFKSIKRLNEEMTRAEISWTGNWVTLLDSMLQLNALHRDYDGIAVPRFIRRLDIDIQHMTSQLRSNQETIEATIFNTNGIRCGDVIMDDIKMKDLPRVRPRPVFLKELKVPFLQSSSTEEYTEKYLSVKSDELLTNTKRSIKLRCTQPGNLKNLHWEEIPEIEQNEILVTVHYAGLNVRDAKRAAGLVPKVDAEIDGYGMDFSGVTKSGERVMGVIRGGAASSHVAAETSMLWPVPAHWTLEDAATVPLPYAHAFYCLGIKYELTSGITILVHGATGALGQAVISIALAHGCIVFATLSDIRKKHFLRKLFPSIPDDQIGNSRDSSFGDMVLSKTKGTGCDVVFNTLGGDIKSISMDCVNSSGVTLDTQQIPCNDNFQFGLSHLGPCRNYVPVDFSSLFDLTDTLQMKRLQLMVSEGIAKGYVRPLSRVVYEPQETARAFQLLTASQHRGRVLLQLQGTAASSVIIPRIDITHSNSHLVVTAETDDVFITRFVNFLISRGAKHIVLQIHGHDTTDAYLQMKIKTWRRLGVDIKISTIDLTVFENVTNLVKHCNSLGPVESIFVLSSGSIDEIKQLEQISAVEELDSVSRKICPLLRYFTIIGFNNNIGQNICIGRNNDGLPATMLRLPKIKILNNEYTSVLQAVERAMLVPCPALLAQIQHYSTGHYLMTHIADITGIKLSESTPENTTLEQLGLNLNMAQIVSKCIEEYTKWAISNEDVLNTTVARIHELERSATAGGNRASGLNILFSYVDPDELMGTHDAVFITTATYDASRHDDEVHTDETYLVIIPGLEGHHKKFHTLCERLKLPAVVLQPGLDHSNETVTEMATRLAEVLFKKLEIKKKFYLLGYSFGVLIALEIAVILEGKGLEGVVFCVDASPDTFSAALDSWLSEAGATDEVRLQDAIVQHMFALMAGDTSQRLKLELHEAPNWSQKVKAGVRALRNHVTLSSQYVRTFIETAYARIEQARRYDAHRLRAHPLRSQLVVLRASSQPASVETDLALSRYSVRAPQLYNISADHARVLDDLRCASIVNRHLDQDILDAFQKRNLCETYFVNTSAFMDICTVEEELSLK